MNNAFIDIQFKGNGFSPGRLRDLTGWPIEPIIESGEIGLIGRYKGKPSPYGFGLLKVEPKANVIFKYAKILNTKKRALVEAKVEEIVFDIEADNMGFESIVISPEVSKLLSEINARIEFHKIPDTDNDNLANLAEKLITHVTTSTSSVQDKVKYEALLSQLLKNKFRRHITPEITYALAAYLIDNKENIKKKEFTSFEKILKESV